MIKGGNKILFHKSHADIGTRKLRIISNNQCRGIAKKHEDLFCQKVVKDMMIVAMIMVVTFSFQTEVKSFKKGGGGSCYHFRIAGPHCLSEIDWLRLVKQNDLKTKFLYK